MAQQHKALSYDDTPTFPGKVLQSAHLFEKQMHELSQRPGLDESSRDFLGGAASLAKGFYLSMERTEYVEKINLAKEEVTEVAPVV